MIFMLYILSVPIVLIGILVASVLHPYPEDPGFTLETLIQQRQAANVNRPQLAIVTGASSGLGLATATTLAQIPGMEVIMACRSVDKCEEVRTTMPPRAQESTQCLPLDLSSRTSIQQFAQKIKRAGDLFDAVLPVDILVNNAGFFGSSSTLDPTYVDDQLEQTIFVNHLGHFYLTNLLWGNLKGGTIVQVSSLSAVFPLDASRFWKQGEQASNPVAGFFEKVLCHLLAYSRSKRANLAFTAELVRRYSGHVHAVASHPGYSRTEIFVKTEALPNIVGKVVAENKLGSMSTEDGARTQVRAALDTNLSAGAYVGPKYWLMGESVLIGSVLEKTSHFWPMSSEESKRVWDRSMEVLGLDDFGLMDE